MINIYTHQKDIKFELKCHTQLGNISDDYTRYFFPGNTYTANLEPITISKDTNNEPCTLVWVDFNDDYGCRFAVTGNIYHIGEDVRYWPHFTNIFDCPIVTERDNKISNII